MHVCVMCIIHVCRYAYVCLQMCNVCACVCVHMFVACQCVYMCVCTVVHTYTCVHNKHCLPYQLCFGQSISFTCLTKQFPQYQPANWTTSSPQKNLSSLRKADTSTRGHLIQIDIPSLGAKYAYKQSQTPPHVHTCTHSVTLFSDKSVRTFFHWHISIRSKHINILSCVQHQLNHYIYECCRH